MPCFYNYAQGWETAPAQRIFLAVPSYDGKLEPMTLIAVMKGMELLRANGIACEFSLLEGHCHVDDARNAMVREFLNTECTDLVFVDADVAFGPDNLLRLVGYDTDLVAGVYPKKQEDTEFAVWPLEGPRNPTAEGLLEVVGAPTGFMRIRRAALERLTEANKDKQFVGQGQSPDDRPHTVLFERMLKDGRRTSGDYAFCQKWREFGGKVFIDPEMDFGHIGPYVWTGRLGDYWRREAGEEPVRFIEAMDRLKAGDPKPEDFVTLHDTWDNPWAATPDFLISAFYMAKAAKGPVLETGSGLSTLVMAAAGAKVTALEHDLAWYRRVTGVLGKLGLSANVEYVRLDKYDGWYCWEPVQDYALLVLDGPPRNLNAGAREYVFTFPQVQGADWIIDDADSVSTRPFEVFGTDRKFVVAKRPA